MRRSVALRLVLGIITPLAGCASPPPQEYVNIAYHPGIDVSHSKTWDFDRARWVDSGVPGVPDSRIRENLRSTIEAELTERGFPRAPTGQSPDFRIWSEVTVDSLDEVRDTGRVRGKIFLWDVRSSRTVWRGERKMSGMRAGNDVESERRVHEFVRTLLDQLAVLGPPFDRAGPRTRNESSP